MVSLRVDIKKKDLWLVSAIFVFLVGVGVVVAWDSNNPALHGHTANEILGNLSGGEGSDGGMSFGDWVDKSSNYGAQQAITDGIVMAYTNGLENEDELRGYTDSNSNPLTLRAYYRAPRAYADGHVRYTLMMPVKKDHYWKVEGSAGEISNVYWLPIISSGDSGGFIPSIYAGEESVTFPNGMIMKQGKESDDGIVTITFDDSFPEGVISVICQPIGNVGGSLSHGEEVRSVDTDGFVYEIHTSYDGFYWTAIGY